MPNNMSHIFPINNNKIPSQSTYSDSEFISVYPQYFFISQLNLNVPK